MTTDALVVSPDTKLSRAWLNEPPYALITLVLLVVVWQLACTVGGVPNYLLPSPYQIGRDLVVGFPYFIPHTTATAWVILTGFLASVAVGVPIAVMLSYSRILNKSLYPLIVGSQVVPKVAIAPLMLAWFGFGITPKIAIVIPIPFFPVFINSVVGFRSAPPQMLFLAQSMGASLWQTFFRFCLPNALPSILAGLKMAAVLAVIGAVVAEFVGSDKGLGYVILIAGSNFDITRQFSAIILLTVLGMAFFWVIEFIERRVIPWHVSVRTEI
ncbi:ABC transporter permease [Mesorhizobium sp. M7D.F.Ca.US.004.03.1.1]|uniref:ABC transporter permease n=1 Tax=Mesorhizobium sp. M7D.F.Ca.US.004.03.1.1 TaxID=2496702 RepID=UPI000FCBC643|nr:ABC transporter permease [Mesorhizobium sp. M7D.F.Ca.US.004.03.1.1]RVA23920.1 ABC transporter permease [Mesorhizobium sp. M7D.F.Ca.US.004.03.1.1]